MSAPFFLLLEVILDSFLPPFHVLFDLEDIGFEKHHVEGLSYQCSSAWKCAGISLGSTLAMPKGKDF